MSDKQIGSLADIGAEVGDTVMWVGRLGRGRRFLIPDDYESFYNSVNAEFPKWVILCKQRDMTK